MFLYCFANLALQHESYQRREPSLKNVLVQEHLTMSTMSQPYQDALYCTEKGRTRGDHDMFKYVSKRMKCYSRPLWKITIHLLQCFFIYVYTSFQNVTCFVLGLAFQVIKLYYALKAASINQGHLLYAS